MSRDEQQSSKSKNQRSVDHGTPSLNPRPKREIRPYILIIVITTDPGAGGLAVSRGSPGGLQAFLNLIREGGLAGRGLARLESSSKKGVRI